MCPHRFPRMESVWPYPGIRADVELVGGVFVDEPVVVDGSLVTWRGWPDLPYFMSKFLEVLAGA